MLTQIHMLEKTATRSKIGLIMTSKLFVLMVFKVTLTCLPLLISFYFIDRYIDRRKSRNEGIFRDDRRKNDWR